MTKDYSPKRTLILGAAWTVATRWTIKGTGFINTVIMARLLLPADYGIVAIAMLLVSLIQALMDFSAGTALLRKKEVSRDEIDSAWTLSWLQNIAAGLILLIVSPIAAIYFKEPRIEVVLWVLAICVAVAGAGNIGFTLARKEFNFALEFRHQVICKALGVIATIAGGFWLRDYRALVMGIATGYISGMVFSYIMHPYRPRWNTSKIGDIWAVTKWLMAAGVGGFILRKGDELIAARVGTTSDFGLYNVGADFGQLPVGEVGPAVLRAFLPVLVSMRGGIDEINEAVIKTESAINTITLPIGLGFAAVAAPATSLVLGPAWGGAEKYVAAFALLAALQIIASPFNTLLTMRGHTRLQSKAVWFEFGVFLLASAALVPTFFLLGLVWARMLGSAASLSITLLSVRRQCGVSLKAVLLALARPLVGSTLMYFVVQAVVNSVNGDLIKLPLGIVCGALFYTIWSTCSWLATGRPDGLEATVLGFLQRHQVNI